MLSRRWDFNLENSQHPFALGRGWGCGGVGVGGVDIDRDDCLKIYLGCAPYQDNLYIVLYQELS